MAVCLGAAMAARRGQAAWAEAGLGTADMGAPFPAPSPNAPSPNAAVHCAPVHCNSVRPGRRTSRVAFSGDAPDADDPLLGFAPYLHKQPRRNAITPDRQRAFIAALAASGIVTQAARSIGASLEALYKLRNLPGAEGFATAWEAAVDRGMARLEDCALERAIAGEERVVMRGSTVVERYRRHDTALLIFLLRNRRGRRYSAAASVTLEQMRQQRAEAEARRLVEVDEDAILASINAKLERMRQRQMAGLSLDGDDDDGTDAEARAAAATDAQALDDALAAEGIAAEGMADAADLHPAPGVRVIPDLYNDGDRALRPPRYPVAYRHEPHGEMRRLLASRLDPPLPHELFQAEWQDHQNAANAAARRAAASNGKAQT
ncbi:hypothetical protein [Novosphingobium ovatum]|uniref:hypothetical protein n=1 Tax=Novosphingobium ovatum TaxID=1908523 RepID=UPI00191C1FD5|nr:hypothetical protein [Novosphingobium ovatum]